VGPSIGYWLVGKEARLFTATGSSLILAEALDRSPGSFKLDHAVA